MKTFTPALLLSIVLFATSAHAQYCMLPGRTPYAPQQPGITEFKLNTIDRTSANVESMSTVVVETGDSTVLLQGHSYTVTIKHSEDAVNFPGTRNNIRVWIDYNKNQDFTDANETVISSDFQTPGTFTASFTVPTTAPLGSTRLRATAKMSSDAGHIIPSPCDNPQDPIGYHGEMEDYVVRIASATAVNETTLNTNNITIFPNPTSSDITISCSQVTNKPMKIELFDMTGKMISNLLNTNAQSSASYHFNLNNYASGSGIYLIKVSSDTYSLYRKIIKID